MRIFRCISDVLPRFRIKSDPEEFHVDLIDLKIRNTFGGNFVECYARNYEDIRTHYNIGCAIKDCFNFRVQNGDHVYENLPLKNIFYYYKSHFRVAVSPGWIMEDIETGEFRYWWSSTTNMKVLESPNLITTFTDFLKFLDKLKSIDLYERLERPSYKWQIRMITNLTFDIFKFENFENIRHIPIHGHFLCGCKIPDRVKLKKSLVSFSEYNDSLCFFRCLAYSTKKSLRKDRLERETRQLYNIFCDNFDPTTHVTLDLIPKLEELYKVCISIHEHEENGGAMTIYHHPNIYNYPELLLDLSFCPNSEHNSSAHFSYIANWGLYSNLGYICDQCGMVFKRKHHLKTHKVNSCRTSTKEVYIGQVFSPSKSIFSTLESHYDIKLREMPANSFFAIFDFEAALFPEKDVKVKTEYNKVHVPISFSIFSNVPGYDQTPFTKVSDGDTNKLMQHFVGYLINISNAAYKILKAKYKYIYEYVEQQVREDEISKVIAKLDKVFKVLPVISFNGSRYDLNLIKKFVFQHLQVTSCIKKGNSFLSLRSENLEFLDILNYLQAGSSYSSFLAAFQCEQKKGIFPYEYLDSFEKLNETQLPAKEAFFDSLKNEGISDSDYAQCLNVWRTESMTTLKDYLIYYNEGDVVGFRVAVQKMVDLYLQKGISLFKHGISLPGISLSLLFKGVKDPYVCAKNAKQHDIFTKGIIGGLSVIFKRYAERDKTFIKSLAYSNPKVCKKIIGMDANSLYPFVLASDMPSGLFSHRVRSKFVKNQLVVDTRLGYTEELCYLLMLELEYDISIQTSLSQDGQKRIGQRYYVDGYYFDQKTGISHCWEYCGCFHHKCRFCGFVDDNGAYAKTMQRFDDIRALPNTKLHVLWGHHYDKFRNERSVRFPNMTRWELLQTKIPLTLLNNKPMSVNTLIEHIKAETIFGLVVCSVKIKPSFHSWYDEFPPLTTHKTITIDDVEGIMLDFAKKNGLLKNPKTLLVSTLSVENQVFITPQLAWFYQQNSKYGEEVFIIDEITDFIEFVPRKSFSKFVQQGVADRIAGDHDPSQKINSLVSKSLLNSSYGKTITNKLNQRKVTITNDSEKIYKQMNSPFFSDLNEINDGIYEIYQRHKTIRWNLSRQIGLWVYALSKLHLISFVYDFLKKYLRDSCFEILMCDTDSIYMAISENSLEECVKPHLREEFEHFKYDWLVDPDKFGDNRTPGKFKEEFSGRGFVGTSSKSYICLGEDGDDKVGAKGVNKRQNKLTFETFKNVIHNKETVEIANRGIRFYNNAMHSYTQRKPGLSYFYVKRVVAPDGINTFSFK